MNSKCAFCFLLIFFWLHTTKLKKYFYCVCNNLHFNQLCCNFVLNKVRYCVCLFFLYFCTCNVTKQVIINIFSI